MNLHPCYYSHEGDMLNPLMLSSHNCSHMYSHMYNHYYSP